MDGKFIKKLVICIFFILAFLNAYYHGSTPGGELYLYDYPTYEELLKAYIQAYTQNMQNGIKRLNTEPQTAGRIFRSFL